MRLPSLLAFLVLAPGAFSQKPPPVSVIPKSPQQQAQAQKKPAKPLEPPITRAEVQALVRDAQAKKEEDATRENLAINRRNMVFTGALAIIGFLQICGLIYSLCLTQKSADAARDSADTAKESFLALQRPWIMLEMPQLDRSTGNVLTGKIVKGVSGSYKNVGKAPAIILFWGLEVFEGPLNIKPEEITGCDGHKSRAYVMPDISVDLPPEPMLTPSGPDRRIYVYMMITYQELSGTEHNSLGTWAYDPGMNRFYAISDSGFMQCT